MSPGDPQTTAAASQDGAAPTPSRIGPYQVGPLLGSGGMGAVYRASDTRDGQDCALKVVRIDHEAREEAVRRFENEVAAARDLDHPGIVRILDAGQEGALHYIAMELVEGRSLSDWIEEVDRPFDSRLRMLRRICEAIDHAHRAGLIHRDLKPSNIIVRDVDDRPVVADLGLARAIGSDSSLTRSSDAVGTPAYMAPEQARGYHKRCDARTDVWALSVILYECIVGVRPFQAETSVEIMAAVVTRDPPPPRQVNASIPPRLERVIMQGLSKSMSHRYPSAGALGADIDRLLAGETPVARRYGWFQRHAAKLRRLAPPLLLAAGLLLSLATLVGWITVDHYRQQGAWQTVLDRTFEDASDLAGFHRAHLHIEQTRPADYTVDRDGLVLPPKHWLWLAQRPVRGEVALELEVTWPQRVDGLEVMVNAARDDPSAYWFLPRGHAAQFGGYNGMLTFISPQRQAGPPATAHAVAVDFVPGRRYRLRFVAESEHLRLLVDGREILRYDQLLPIGAGDQTHIGVRCWATVHIHRLVVQRRALPERAGPLIAADALVAHGHLASALTDYTTLADDFAGTAIGEDALARACLTASLLAGREQAMEDLLARLRREYPDSAHLHPCLQAAAARRWRQGEFATALDAAEAILDRWPASRVALHLLDERRQILEPPQADRLLTLIARTPGITRLDLTRLGLTDLSPLAGMPLRSLQASNNQLTGLEPLRGMPLTYLQVSSNRIEDVEPLAGMPLVHLDIANNEIADLEPLAGMALRELAADNTPITDLAPLAGMPIEQLSLWNTPITSIAPLAGMPLRRLELGGTRVQDLTPLTGVPLEELSLSDTPVEDLAPLSGMALHTLSIDGTAVASLEAIADCPIAALNLSGSRVTDCTPLARMPLTRLACSEVPVTTLAPIATHPTLTHLHADPLPMVDSLPLIAMPELRELDLGVPAARTLPGLDTPKLAVLDLRGCPLEDLGALAGLELELLALTGHRAETLDALRTVRVGRLLAVTGSGLDPDDYQSLLTHWRREGRSDASLRQLAAQHAIAAGELTGLADLAQRRGSRRWLVTGHLCTHEEALRIARAAGARLPCPSSHELQQALRNLVRPGPLQECWLGLVHRDGTWRWQNGEVVGFTPNHTHPSNWSPELPVRFANYQYIGAWLNAKGPDAEFLLVLEWDATAPAP